MAEAALRLSPPLASPPPLGTYLPAACPPPPGTYLPLLPGPTCLLSRDLPASSPGTCLYACLPSSASRDLPTASHRLQGLFPGHRSPS